VNDNNGFAQFFELTDPHKIRQFRTGIFFNCPFGGEENAMSKRSGGSAIE